MKLKYDQLLSSFAFNFKLRPCSMAAAMAATKGWRSLVVPAMLVGVLGYATATFFAVAFGVALLAQMPLT